MEKIILKFFENKANQFELEKLLDWITNQKNYEYFVDFSRINYYSNSVMDINDKQKLIEEIQSRIKSDKRKNSSDNSPIIKSQLVISVLCVIILGILLFDSDSLFNTNSYSTIDPSKLTLINSSGEYINLEEVDANRPVNTGDSYINLHDNTIEYDHSATNNITTLYNKLLVPYGKTFKIVLSDGTIVHLNSGSTIKYPVHFMNGVDREVTLTGEAYFKVKNNASIFIVNSNFSSAIVYGTEFNYKEYPEDNFSEIILSEGSLGVTLNKNDEKDIELIVPGERAQLNPVDQQVNISKVNTSIYTSWIDGRLVFRNENLESMIRKLERFYNVIIINNNNELNERFFSATILKEEESITDVLSYLEKVYGLKYKIVNEKIIIE